jgi:hypothetical protein
MEQLEFFIDVSLFNFSLIFLISIKLTLTHPRCDILLHALYSASSQTFSNNSQISYINLIDKAGCWQELLTPVIKDEIAATGFLATFFTYLRWSIYSPSRQHKCNKDTCVHFPGDRERFCTFCV